jgi:N-acylethanolamine-hydrolysing acid amidase
LVAAVHKTYPDYLIKEMQGIGAALNVSLYDVISANLFYEIDQAGSLPFSVSAIMSAACTSLVCQRSNGTVYLARNHDYPPPFSAVMFRAVFVRDGQTLYEGTTFAGTVGLSTGLYRGNRKLRLSSDNTVTETQGWAVSINARDDNATVSERAGLAVAAALKGGKIFPIITREAMDAGCHTYAEALRYYSDRRMIVGGYIIIAGSAPGEGAVITRNSTGGVPGKTDVLTLQDRNVSDTDPGGGAWMVLQTNTDHWRVAPNYPGFNISRLTKAHDLLDAIGKDNVDLLAMWDVLNTPPVFNFATIHTDLVSPEWNEYRSYKQNGPFATTQH